MHIFAQFTPIVIQGCSDRVILVRQDAYKEFSARMLRSGMSCKDATGTGLFRMRGWGGFLPPFLFRSTEVLCDDAGCVFLHGCVSFLKE